MKDRDKNKDQLIEELEFLRHRVATLELGVAQDARLGEEAPTFPIPGQNARKEAELNLEETETWSRTPSEQELRNSETRFQTLIEQAGDAFFLVETGGKIVEVNQHACDSLGYTREELLAMSVADVDVETQTGKHKERYWDQLTPGKPRTLEGTHRRKDGTTFPVEIRLGLLQLDGQPYLLGLARDVTERKRMEETIKRLVEVASGRFGTAFFESMAAQLSKAVGADYTLIGELQEGEKESIRTLSVIVDGELADNFEYELANTPCENVVGKSACSYASGVAGQFPKDVLLEQMGVEGYVGVPLFDSQHSALGIMATLFRKPLTNTDFAESVLQIFSSWTGSEIERMRSEEELARVSRLQRSAVDNAPIWISTLDAQGNVSLWNHAAEQISGYSKGAVLGHGKIWEWLYPDVEYRNQLFGNAKALMDNGAIFEDFETVIRAKDGKKRVVSWLSSYLKDDEGKTVGSVALGTDITDRKLAQEALQESQERFRVLFEEAPDAIYLNDLEGRLVDGNRAAEGITGYQKEELVGKSFLTAGLLTPSDVPEAAANLARNAAGHPTGPSEFTLKRKDGTLVTVEIRTFPVTVKAQKLVLGIARDVTQRKRAEQALRESEEQFRNVFENSMIGLYRTTPDGRILMANSALVRILAYASFEELAERDIEQEGYAPGHSRSVFRQRIEADGRIIGHEAAWIRRDGSTTHVRESARVVRDQAGNVLYYEGTVEDITERRLTQEALRESEATNRAILEALPDLMFRLSRDGKHIDFHASHAQELYVAPESIIGKTVDDLLPAEVAREYMKHIERTFENQAMEVFEYQLEFPEKDRHSFEARMVLCGEDSVLTIVRNITDRKRTEEALKASEARYRAIVEDQTELICRNLPDATITFVNEAYCRCFDRSRDELVGEKFMPMIPEEDLPQVRRYFASLGPETPVATHEHRVIMPDGQIRWQQWTNRAILDDAGQVIEFQGTGRDITERKKAQERSRIAHSYLQLLKSVAVAANEAATVEEAFQTVLNEVCARMDWEMGGAVVAAGDVSRELECLRVFNREFPRRWEPLREAWESDSFKPEEGLPGHVFREKRPIMVTDEQLRANPTQYVFGRLALKLGMKCAFGFPVWVGREVGAVLCFVSSASKQPDEQHLGVMTDVGVQLGRVIERKLAEEALRKSEKRARGQLAELNHVYDTAPVGLCLVDAELRYVRINERLATMNGKSVAEHIGRRLKEVIPDIASQVEPVFRKVMESGQPAHNLEVHGVTQADPDVERDWLVSYYPVKSDDGTLLGAGIVVQEITERRRAEETLKASEARYRAIVEDQTELIARSLPDRTLTFVNEAYCRYFGKNHDELVGHRFTPLVHPEDEAVVREHYLSLTRVNPVATCEHRVIASDGEVRWNQWTNRAIFDESGRLVEFQGAGRDITDRKRAEEMLHRMQSQLAHVARVSTMGEMVAGIAHEVNQPLYSIRNFAKASGNVLAAGEGVNLDELREWNAGINKAATHAAETVRRLRGFVKRSHSRRSFCKINEILDESVQLVAPEARRRQIAVRRELREVSPIVHVDRVEIQQVLVNLLQNACEAMDEGGVGVREVTICTEITGEFVDISVADNGPGLPSEDDLHVFDAFVTTKQDGLGMGLAIVTTIVEAHGGRLWAASNRKGGATFRFTLPVMQEGQSDDR